MSDTTSHGSLTRPVTVLVSEACETKRRSTNVLTSGGPKATKEQHLAFGIVRACFIAVDDSVLGVLYLEFLTVNKLDE